MRIFIAVLFDEAVKEKIYEYIKLIKKDHKGNFTTFDNLHLTIYFIGELNESQLSRVKKRIEELEFEAFNLEINGIGSFQNTNNQRLVHLKTEPNLELKNLHLKVLQALKKARINIKSTDFNPHITLGRKVEIDLPELFKIETNSIDCLVKKVSVMESKRVDNQLVYEEVN